MRVVFRCPPALAGLIPAPAAATRSLPAWLRAMPRTAFAEESAGEVATVKQCPPFIDAMSTGFVIPLAVDLTVEDGTIAWDWDPPAALADVYPRAPLGFHLDAQVTGTPFHEPDTFLVKFNNFWTIALDPGYALLVTHPLNRPDLPFRTIAGVVDADRFADALVHFPALWTDPHFTGVLPKGTPVAQCLPFRREAIELVVEPLEGEAEARYLAETRRLIDLRRPDRTGLYRREFRMPKR